MNLLFISNDYTWSNILYLYKYLPPCHQNIRYNFYNIQLCVPPSKHYRHSCWQHISAIYKNIYLLYIHNIINIIINMTSHAQYLKVDHKSSVILYYNSYAILGLLTSFHPWTIELDHNIFYRIAWDGVVHLTC